MVCTTVTHPHPLVWQLTLSLPPDNRLTPDALQEMMCRLDQIEADWRRANAGKPPAEWQGGALVVTGGGPKFFSNGLDPETTKNPDFTKGASPAAPSDLQHADTRPLRALQEPPPHLPSRDCRGDQRAL